MTTPSPYPSKIPRPRLWGWLLITLVLLAAVWLIAPQQLPVSLYKLSLVTLAAVVGYWLDRSLFPYARPDAFLAFEGEPEASPEEDHDTLLVQLTADQPLLHIMGITMLRRAIIVGCAMLAMGLGA